MPNAIEITNLSKIYRLGEIGSGTISRDLERWFRMKIRGQEDPFLKIGEINVRNIKGKSDVIYALKDINIEIEQGSALGIIGRNGAGKSTLLKLLSRVTSPTSGRIKIKGRIASLLEIGTGFHPELTGRENIYINGAILGMRKKEITGKLDEIIDFSEVERYIDTPVKRYSSGMYVRLAFAVAAHLDSEILILDEVLAVGDAAFYKKSLGKMSDVSRGGRTILFVSHNLSAISVLCSKSILLDNGTIIESGPTDRVIDVYHKADHVFLNPRRNLEDPLLRNKKISFPESQFKWREISIFNSKAECANNLRFGEPFEVRFSGIATENCEPVLIGLALISERTGYIFTTHQVHNGLPGKLSKGTAEFIVKIPDNYLAPGKYSITIAASGNPNVSDYIVDDAISLTILDIAYDENSQWRSDINSGALLYPCEWQINAH